MSTECKWFSSVVFYERIRVHLDINPRIPIAPTAKRNGMFPHWCHRRGIMGRKTHAFNTCAQVAAPEHLYDAIFRCKQAPSFLEIFLDNSMQQKNEQALEWACDCKKVV